MMGLKHQAAAARKWRSAARQIMRHFPPHLPPLLFLTDPDRTSDPCAIAATLPPGSGVIYRHFGAEDRQAVGARLLRTCRANACLLLISADPILADRLGADGVHWPEARLSEAKDWRGRFVVQTASAHSRAAIYTAERAGMDAALVSSLFLSRSKTAGRPMGPARFRALSAQTPLPLYALGGIHTGNVHRICQAGGAAAIDGFLAGGSN